MKLKGSGVKIDPHSKKSLNHGLSVDETFYASNSINNDQLNNLNDIYHQNLQNLNSYLMQAKDPVNEGQTNYRELGIDENLGKKDVNQTDMEKEPNVILGSLKGGKGFNSFDRSLRESQLAINKNRSGNHYINQ